MADVRPFRDGAQLRREASAWIARLNAEHASDEDRASFERWRTADGAHARAYEEVAATWQQLNHTGKLVRAVTLGQAFGASTEEAIRRSRRATRRRSLFAAAAATLAMAAVAGWWWVSTLAPRTLFQTAIGEHATVALPDGSTLEINSNSRVRVDYSDAARLVRLERGEAFFNVAHDSRRPFWVGGGGSWVRAVGTAFNVHVERASVRVTVSEGTVQVVANGLDSGAAPPSEPLTRTSAAVLKAGQEVSMQRGLSEVRALAPKELSRALAWRDGIIYFEEGELADVVAELSRYTTLHIVIQNDALRELSIGGTFETNESGAQALLATLQDGFGIPVRREGRTAYIGATP